MAELRGGARGGGVVARLEGARRVYDRGGTAVHALRGLDLEVHAGELVALVGPSGCGKSTTLGLLAAVDRPDGGRVEVCGLDLGSADEDERTRLRREDVGVVFQAFHLVPDLTAAENVTLPLSLAGRSDPGRVRDLLERIGLADRADHYPGELSGGEQQRVAVARALVHGPRLVIADEPTGNLDTENGARVLALLEELRESEGAALVLATHDLAIAARADRIVRMVDGSLAAE